MNLGNGNGKLEFPTAILTADEAAYAGYVWGQDSYNNYLNIDYKLWWTMSPTLVSAGIPYVGVSYSIFDNVSTNYSKSGIRPSISLKKEFVIKDGYGTVEEPFIINEDL